MGLKQQIKCKANQSNKKSGRLGDGKPFPRSPQMRGHKLGGYPDWGKGGNAMVVSSPGGGYKETPQKMAKTAA